jgi:hypothetical protein
MNKIDPKLVETGALPAEETEGDAKIVEIPQEEDE